MLWPILLHHVTSELFQTTTTLIQTIELYKIKLTPTPSHLSISYLRSYRSLATLLAPSHQHQPYKSAHKSTPLVGVTFTTLLRPQHHHLLLTPRTSAFPTSNFVYKKTAKARTAPQSFAMAPIRTSKDSSARTTPYKDWKQLSELARRPRFASEPPASSQHPVYDLYLRNRKPRRAVKGFPDPVSAEEA